MHLLSQIIYSCKTLYMLWTVFPSISWSSKQRIWQRYMSNRDEMGLGSISSPIAAGSSSCLTYTVAVYTVLSSWWWTESLSETCRAFYKNKQFEIMGASCWLYYRNDAVCFCKVKSLFLNITHTAISRVSLKMNRHVGILVAYCAISVTSVKILHHNPYYFY